MKIIVDEAGEIIAKATDDHTLVGGHHSLALHISMPSTARWNCRDTHGSHTARLDAALMPPRRFRIQRSRGRNPM